MSEFEQKASAPNRGGLLRDAWAFLRETKKWWLIPIVITLILVTLLVYLSSSAAAPFIYTLF
jgi:Family of unknown function (DUF5989)